MPVYKCEKGVYIGMRTGMCICMQVQRHVRRHVYRDVHKHTQEQRDEPSPWSLCACIGTYTDMRVNMRMNMRMDMHIDMCTKQCIDTYTDMWHRHACADTAGTMDTQAARCESSRLHASSSSCGEPCDGL